MSNEVQLGIWMMVLCLAVWALSGPDDQQVEQNTYCEMIQIYEDTNGEYGWPDYKQIGDEQCSIDQ